MPKLIIGIVVIALVALGGYALTREGTPGASPEPSPSPTIAPSPTPIPTRIPTPMPTVAPTTPPAQTATPTPSTSAPSPSLSPSPSPTVQTVTITADDDTYSPSGPVMLDAGAVRMTFIVREENVYFGGLEFRGGPVNTGAIEPGGSRTVEFTAISDFTITAYWPASGVVKYDIPVVVR